MARKLAATKNAHAGLLNKRQLLFAMFDQYIHSRETDEPVDTAAILKKFHDTVMRSELALLIMPHRRCCGADVLDALQYR